MIQQSFVNGLIGKVKKIQPLMLSRLVVIDVKKKMAQFDSPPPPCMIGLREYLDKLISSTQ